jgi:hypothetical protein
LSEVVFRGNKTDSYKLIDLMETDLTTIYHELRLKKLFGEKGWEIYRALKS